jgi:hypothetical protein
MIATSRKDRGYGQIWEACPLLESLQLSIWIVSVELTSQRRTSLASMESSSWPKLASRHPCDWTCHCIIWWRDAMWLYTSSTSTVSNIEMISILPWHPLKWSIHHQLWTGASNDSILDFGATHMWIPVNSSCIRTSPVLSSNLPSHPKLEVLQCGLWFCDSQRIHFGDQVSV